MLFDGGGLRPFGVCLADDRGAHNNGLTSIEPLLEAAFTLLL